MKLEEGQTDIKTGSQAERERQRESKGDRQTSITVVSVI